MFIVASATQKLNILTLRSRAKRGAMLGAKEVGRRKGFFTRDSAVSPLSSFGANNRKEGGGGGGSIALVIQGVCVLSLLDSLRLLSLERKKEKKRS